MTTITMVLVLTSFFFPAVLQQATIPPGTVLPARLDSSLNPRKNKPGDVIHARIMQDVPLLAGGRVPEGSRVVGRIVSVQAGGAGQPAGITIRFDRLEVEHQPLSISTSLRALASIMEVEDAQSARTGPDRGTPWATRTRNLVGGEVSYGDGGPVTRRGRVVGQALVEGVLARLEAGSGSRCRGEAASDQPQALWVFSSDACGLYGFPSVEISHAGRTDPVGVVTLTSREETFNIQSGSGMLLRVTNLP